MRQTTLSSGSRYYYHRHRFLTLVPAVCLVIFSMIPYAGFAQVKDRSDNKELFVKLNLTSLVDQFSFPTVQLSAEQKLSPRFSISAELGSQLYSFKRAGVDTGFVDRQGWKGNIEFRYYDFLSLFISSRTDRERRAQTYIGLNFFFRNNRYNINVFYMKPNDPSAYNDCFWVKKKITGINLVLGIQKELGDRFILDLYGGIGGLNRKSRNFNREYNAGTDSLIRPHDLTARSIFDDTSLEENNGAKGSFNLGIRLGIKLQKRQGKRSVALAGLRKTARQ